MKITKPRLKKLIDVAAGRDRADLLIKNCKIVDVYSGNIIEDNIAITEGMIAGIGDYDAVETVDAHGKYASPGLIDGHIHIESSYCSPEEFGRMVVPHGTTTVIADPHEIVNVCGMDGFNYMVRAAEKTELSVRYMVPSCVPSTSFENAGAIINAYDMKWPMMDEHVPGLGEFMNYPGVISGSEDSIDKIMTAKDLGKIVDGHSPSVGGKDLNAYSAAGILTDHECSTVEEMEDRISRGMYVQLRQGSACHNMTELAKGITKFNFRRCLVCSDDRQPKTIIEEGHVDGHLRRLVSLGIDPCVAICMASLNAAECYRLYERGAIAPGKRADIVLFDDLKEFAVDSVYIEGEKVAEHGKYIPVYSKCDIAPVRGSMHIKPFDESKLEMNLKSDKVHVIEMVTGGVLSKKSVAVIRRDEKGDFVFDPADDIVKCAVVERHHSTGNIGLGLIKGYGIKHGAVALSVAHDSHNVICVGVNNKEMKCAIDALRDQEGGFVLVRDGKVVESLPLPIAGLMSDQSGEWVAEKLNDLHKAAFDKLGISTEVEPIMTLCFMSLLVIPELKLSDMGLFDVTQFKFIPIEAE